MTVRGRSSTHIALPILLIGAFAVAAVVPAAADSMKEHTVVAPEQVKWGPAPASIPAGAEAAVLYGDPSKEGLFALRLKLPPGYHIPPHWHPKPEIVTVISGTFRLGMGERADEGKAEALPAGSFFAFAPRMVHYAYADGETVVQLNSTGPWGLTYVNPKDDPRQQASQ